VFCTNTNDIYILLADLLSHTKDMMHVNIYDSILVTLPADIHAKYQTCMLEADAYNHTHAQYLQSYRANKDRVGLLRRNQIMFNALATLHTFRTLHRNTRSIQWRPGSRTSCVYMQCKTVLFCKRQYVFHSTATYKRILAI